MPVDVGGGGGPVQHELASVWSNLAQSCRAKATELYVIPVLGPLLAGAFTVLADAFELADRHSGDFATMYERLSSAVDALVNGEGLGEALDHLFPDWRLLASDPVGWVTDHLPLDWASIEDLIYDMVAAAVRAINLGGQWIEGLVADPQYFLSELIRVFFPSLYPFFDLNDSGSTNWAYIVAQGLMGLAEDVRRDLGRALFGMMGLDWEAGEDLILALITKALEWIDAHKPDFKTLAYTILGKIIRYFWEGTI